MEEGEKLKTDRKGAGGGGDPDLCPVEGPQNVNNTNQPETLHWESSGLR